MNLSEISECNDDSSDTENITLSRIQEITAKELARFDYLSETRSPPKKKSRLKSPSVVTSDESDLKLFIPSSICDDSSVEVSPFSQTSTIEMRELVKVQYKSDTDLTNKVRLLPKIFRTSSRSYKKTPKILDLKLLSNINTTTETNLPSSSSGKSEENNENDFICTGLDVPVVCKPKANFPAISKITTNILNLSTSPVNYFDCIYDTDYPIKSPQSIKESLNTDDYVTYKEICKNASAKETKKTATICNNVANALLYRETQSIELPYYDIAPSSNSKATDSITLVSESEDTQKETSSVWWKCPCLRLRRL